MVRALPSNRGLLIASRETPYRKAIIYKTPFMRGIEELSQRNETKRSRPTHSLLQCFRYDCDTLSLFPGIRLCISSETLLHTRRREGDL